MTDTHTAYLAYGSNIGEKEENILNAYRMTEERVGRIVRRSAMMRSEPWGFKSDNGFVNSVACVETILTPHQLLEVTQSIERAMGRTEKSHGGVYHDRIIDIDILLYDDITLNDADLVIPHPLMHERDFVMKPLNEIRHT
jgi:2-amino-4-hydroxy-6-hydroxymethyldihydropteridine diphosphokinase